MRLEQGADYLPLTFEEFNEIICGLNIGAPGKVAVAVSGGGDSMALSYLLNDWCKTNDIELVALTVNHGLRETSTKEATQVAKWFSDEKIEHHILNWRGDKPESNIQNAARKARYELMGGWCAANDIAHLFLAHHQDDQAETFLIRLFRGSGVDGLSGMRQVAPLPLKDTQFEMPCLYRPLLNIPKKRLIENLKLKDRDWINDPSNENTNFTRVNVRNLINQSKIEGLNSKRISQTAEKLSRVRSFLEEVTDKADSRYITYHKLGYAVLEADFFENLHEEISLRLLSSVLKKIGGGTYGPRYQKLISLYENLKNKNFQGQTILGCNVFPGPQNKIIFVREDDNIEEEIFITDKEQYLWDNRIIVKCSGSTGTLKRITSGDLAVIKLKYPEFKNKLKAAIEYPNLRNRILHTLPCFIRVDHKIIFPEIIADELDMPELDKFSAVFKN